jgi:hypothetical protein
MFISPHAGDGINGNGKNHPGKKSLRFTQT